MALRSLAEPRWFTAEDLEKMPPELRVELINGELRKMPPPPNEEHGSLTNEFGWRVSAFVDAHDLGRCYAAETGFKIRRQPDTVRGPDFAFVSRERLNGPPGKKHLPLAPDLVLETLSPSQSLGYVDEKIDGWLRAGSRMGVVADSDARTLTVHRPGREAKVLTMDDEFDGEDVLPGFRLPVRQLFGGG